MGCISTEYYPKESIILREIVLNDTSIRIFYSYPMETMYYSKGVDYVYDSACNQIIIKFVRQSVKGFTKKVMIDNELTNFEVYDSITSNIIKIDCNLIEISIESYWDLSKSCKNEIIRIEN